MTKAETAGAKASKQKKQAMGEHFRAMRRMVVIIAVVVICFFMAIFYLFSQPLIDFILNPVTSRGVTVISTRVSESLMMRFKTCLVAALVVSMPVIIFEIWSFVSPALYPREKRSFIAIFLIFVALFAIGVVFSYIFVFPLAVDLFYEASEGVATPMWSVEGYFDFILSFVLPFGLMFELPAVIYILARKGKVNPGTLAKNRKFFTLGASIVAAILTPPDVISQVLLLLPLLALYEVSVLISRTVRPPAEEEAVEAADA